MNGHKGSTTKGMADVNEVLSQLDNVSYQSIGDESSRLKALQQAQQLVQRLETPSDTVKRMMWVDPSINLSLKACFELGVFGELSSGPKSTEALARTSGAEPALLRRFLRQLAAAAHIQEQDEDVWASTHLSNAMVSDGLGCTSDFLYDIGLPAYGAAPSILKEIGWSNPNNSSQAPWFRGQNTTLPFFEWLNQHPKTSVAFNETMRVTSSGSRIPWFTVYPAHDRLLSRFDPEISTALLVDVGGSIGHDVESFHREYPDHQGHLIVQDLATVIAKADIPKGAKIETQAHSFLDPQPVKHAAAYFLGSILHDWADAEAQQILSHLKNALKPSYSRILIREPILPPKGASLLHSSMDLVMMTLFGAKERTKRDWDELASSVGLKVASVWPYPGGSRYILELVLKDDPA